MTRKEETLYFLREWRTIPTQLTVGQFDEYYLANKGVIRIKYMPSKKGSNKNNVVNFPIQEFSRAALTKRVKSVRFLKEEIKKNKAYFKITCYEE